VANRSPPAPWSHPRSPPSGRRDRLQARRRCGRRTGSGRRGRWHHRDWRAAGAGEFRDWRAAGAEEFRAGTTRVVTVSWPPPQIQWQRADATGGRVRFNGSQLDCKQTSWKAHSATRGYPFSHGFQSLPRAVAGPAGPPRDIASTARTTDPPSADNATLTRVTLERIDSGSTGGADAPRRPRQPVRDGVVRHWVGSGLGERVSY
jgi:hypothetical protein